MAPQKESVREMFNAISFRYDFLNHFFSFGFDHAWRKAVCREIRKKFPHRQDDLDILDIASGTGDLALEMARIRPKSVTAVDMAVAMMEIGKKKTAAKNLHHIVAFREEDAERLSFDDDRFDVVAIAFGVRNFENLEAGLTEMIRVVKPGGMMIVLEFSRPGNGLLPILYTGYSRTIIPVLGRWISQHPQAYRYLPDTISDFPSGEEFLDIVRQCGWKNPCRRPLTGGIASLYMGEK